MIKQAAENEEFESTTLLSQFPITFTDLKQPILSLLIMATLITLQKGVEVKGETFLLSAIIPDVHASCEAKQKKFFLSQISRKQTPYFIL